MHGIFGVVAVLSDELLTLASTSATVGAAPEAEESQPLGLHVASIARNDVAAYEGIAQVL
jgi:hypothetical protein